MSTIHCLSCKMDTGVTPLSRGELTLVVSMPPTQTLYEKDYFCCRECDRAYAIRHRMLLPVGQGRNVPARHAEWNSTEQCWREVAGQEEEEELDE